MQTQTIENIKQIVNEVELSLRSFIVKEHAGANFGQEQEYTAQSLKSGLKAILGDLRGLAKAHGKFVRISNYEERHQICNHLVEINTHLNSKDYHSVALRLDQLKLIVRPYNLRTSSESENDITERINKLNALCTQSEDKLEEAERIRERMEATRKNVEDAEECLSAFSQKLAELEQKSGRIDILQQKSHEHSAQINELLIQSKSNEGVIKSFAEQVQKRTSQLEEQEQKTNEYESKLTKYKEERAQIIKAAKKLIEDARSALSYTTTSGISAAFNERYEKEEKKGKWNLLWLAGAGAFIVGAGVIGFLVIYDQKDLTLGMSVARIAIMSVAISAAWFCATQYVRYKNTLDDYGYKSVLAKSIVAFLDQFKDPEERAGYLQTVLSEIHQDPLRKKHDVDTPVSKLFETFGNRKNDKDSETGEKYRKDNE